MLVQRIHHLAGTFIGRMAYKSPKHGQLNTEDHFSVHLLNCRSLGLDPIQLGVLHPQCIDCYNQGRAGYKDGREFRAESQLEGWIEQAVGTEHPGST